MSAQMWQAGKTGNKKVMVVQPPQRHISAIEFSSLSMAIVGAVT